jgi:toxin ParE1/3/4
VPEPHTIHPSARRELARAERWYRREATLRVADALLNAFEDAVERACRAPQSCSPVVESKGVTYRSVRLRPFPYRLIFYVRKDGVRVIAVAHVRRQPDYWKWRLGS